MSIVFLDILLGAVQGLTEFLPISSSAHLVIADTLFGVGEPNIFFDTLLHISTLGAVFVFFRKELLQLSVSRMKLIVVGTIPAAVVGILFKDVIEGLFGLAIFVGFELIISGLINLWADRMLAQRT